MNNFYPDFPYDIMFQPHTLEVQEPIWAVTKLNLETLKEDIVTNLKLIFDPEISFNIYDMGLIYDINIEKDVVIVNMSLTSPNCPSAQSLPNMVKRGIEVIGIKDPIVNVVWNPIWTPEKISKDIRMILGIE